MYQALYRKYRPLIFSDVVGQTHVTDTLRAQVAADRLSHAYLFTGTRGTGKTSCAKILARAANCLNPQNGNPCNQCDPCLGMLEGSLLDVMEIDAASNSGVDNIRALRDETAYTPVSARKRVYIIDEVHMLSMGAFNALLKTLEEPPSYVLFILATTETHKVPATILSRCQRFAFKRLGEDDIAARLTYVAGQENLSLTEEAAKLLARLSDGALRDALSLLDQCTTSVTGTIGKEETYQALGLINSQTLEVWAEAIAQKDVVTSLNIFNDQLQSGRDIASLLGELSQYIRDTLMDSIQGGTKTGALQALPNQEQLSLLNILQEGLSQLSRAPRPRIEAELCLLRMCMAKGDLETRVQRLESGIQGGLPLVAKPPVVAHPSGPSAPMTAAPPKTEEPAQAPVIQVTPKKGPPEVSPNPETVPTADPELVEAVPPAPEVTASPVTSGGDWKHIIALAVAQLPNSLCGFLLQDTVSVQQSEGMWQIQVTDDLTYTRLNCKNVTQVFQTLAEQATGHPVSVRVVKQDKQEQPTSHQLKNLLDQFNK